MEDIKKDETLYEFVEKHNKMKEKVYDLCAVPYELLRPKSSSSFIIGSQEFLNEFKKYVNIDDIIREE